jgi:hypothetical protein
MVTSPRHGWTEYGVPQDETFEVFAFGVYSGKLMLLLDLSDDSRPVWFDASDFVITSSNVHQDWKATYSEGDDWSLVMGYAELIGSDDHFNGLLERVEVDMQIFCRIKERYRACRSR